MPVTSSALTGAVLPIPTNPFAKTVIRVVVDVPPVVEAMVKSVPFAAEVAEFEIESCA